MAKCVKCKSRLPFLDIIFLSKFSNRILCKKCNVVLEGSITFSGVYGGFLAGFITLSSNRSALNYFGISEDYRLHSSLLSLLLIIILSIGFYYRYQLKISPDQSKAELEDTFELKERPKLPDNPTRVEYLKNRFFYKSNAELSSICNDPHRVVEAKEAAKQLLKERNNVT